MHRLVAALVALSAASALADFTLVSTAVSDGASREVTLSVRGGRAVFEVRQGAGEPRVMLRDGEAGKMYVVNHGRKELVVLTEQDGEQLKAQQAQLRAQFEAQLSRLSPEQRKRIEATMGGAVGAPAKPPQWSWDRKASPARKVAGFSCQDYVIKRDGQVNGEGCFAQWKDLGLSADDFRQALKRAMPRLAGDAASVDLDSQDGAPGFPLHRTFVDEQGKVKTETTLKSLAKTSLPADRFELPRGYQVRDMGEAMRALPGGGKGPLGAPFAPPATP